MPDDPSLQIPFEMAGCRVVLVERSRRQFDMKAVWQTTKLVRHLKIDIFHCHNDHTSPLIGAFLGRAPVRIWSKLSMSPYYETGEAPRGLKRLFPGVRVSAFCCTKILPISEQVQNELLELGCPSGKLSVLYGPVDYDRFARGDKNVTSVRKEFGISQTATLLAAVGHTVPVKGWDIAIKAFSEVMKQCKDDIHLLLVGGFTSSEFHRYLEGLVRKFRLEKKVTLAGNRQDIPRLLKASDIFVFPSRSEGLPAALIEAMASGLPCIASRVGGIPEIIQHGVDGMLFERENEKALSQLILQLIGDPVLCKNLAKNASERARHFLIESYVNQLIQIYLGILLKLSKNALP